MADRELLVRIIGDDRSLQQAFTRSSRASDQWGKSINRSSSELGRFNQTARGFLSGFGGRSSLLFGSGAFIGSAALTAGLKASVTAASSLNEEIARSGQVFEDSSRDVLEWSRTTAEALGISQVEALRASGSIGNMVTAMGIGEERAAAMSVRMVQLAADMASFNNEDPSAMLERIRSGLSGELEPLRRFGSVLSATRVEQFAWANGIADAGDKLNEQQKILARYGLLLQDTAKQHGDVERTQDSFANQTREMNANLDDLSATIGDEFLPALTNIVSVASKSARALDGLVRAVGDFRDTTHDTSGLELFGRAIEGADEKAGGFFQRLSAGIPLLGAFRGALQASSGGHGGQIELPLLDEAIRLTDELLAKTTAIGEKFRKQAELARSRTERREERDFSSFLTGLGLKLDRAEITKSTSDDLAVLQEMERAIERRIREEGRTFKLVEQLVRVRGQIASVREGQAQDAAEASQNAFQRIIDGLSMRLERAQVTKSFQDDLAVLEDIERAIRTRIRSEGRTTDLLQQLQGALLQQAEVRRQIAERQRDLRRQRQLEALGLTAEGGERIAGVGALRRRASNLEEQIKGTVLDTAKTRAQLDRIGQVLSGRFGKVGRDVREAILGMLNDITSALDDKKGGKGDTTKFVKRGIDDMLEGLGLSPEQIKELRQRFARVGPGGTVPGQGIGAFGFAIKGAPPTTTTGGRTVEEFHIYIDGAPVEATVTRRQQKKRGRNSPSRRGVRPGV